MTEKTDELDSYLDEDESSEETIESPEAKTEETETKESEKVETESKSEEKSEESSEKSEEKPEESETTSQDSNSVPKPALLDERRKRQELEKQLEELRALVPKQETEPDMYEDAEAWKEWSKNQILNEQRTEQEKLLRDKLETSRSQQLESQSDYNQMEVVFEVLASRDNSLASKMLASDDPAKFAYDTAKKEGGKLFSELFGQPVDAEKVIAAEKTEDDETDSVDLTNASSQVSNVPKKVEEQDLDDIFADQGY
jgi:hypothetical protein